VALVPEMIAFTPCGPAVLRHLQTFGDLPARAFRRLSSIFAFHLCSRQPMLTAWAAGDARTSGSDPCCAWASWY